jgi:alpha,alpha-trehalose phosphorylase (configuration-retaining)
MACCSDPPPCLIIAGVGSIDDPEGNRVYEEAHAYITQPQFAPYTEDILLIKIPPCDQLLNTLMSRATVYLQLSIQEGFEIKVTEAVRKGVPVIAYATGGIVLQVQHDITGFLVPVFAKDQVVECLLRLLLREPGLHARMSHACRETCTESLSVAYQACSWMCLVEAVASQASFQALVDEYVGRVRHTDELWGAHRVGARSWAFCPYVDIFMKYGGSANDEMNEKLL